MTPSKANDCVVVPWDCLRDVKLDAWYRMINGNVAAKIEAFVDGSIDSGRPIKVHGYWRSFKDLADCFEHLPNPDGPTRTWLPCTKTVAVEQEK